MPPPTSAPPLWFDAHLDLACLAVLGRDLCAPLDPLEQRSPNAPGPNPPGCVSLPALRDGGVRFALATVFTERGGSGPEGYPADDIERAHRAGRAQIEVYLTLRDKGELTLDLLRALRDAPGVGEIRGGMGVAEVIPPSLNALAARLARDTPLRVGVLIENADPVRSPDELPWWVERGVVAIGLSWHAPSRYAGGNSCETGLTDLGREMALAMDALGVVHDLSHLSRRSIDDLLSMTDTPVMASHSNSRALFPENLPLSLDQRMLRDDAIAEVGRRGGVIGLNLFSAFLRHETERASIDDAIAHVEHVCEVTGSRAHVGLGSDMDGGFAATRMPEGVESPRDMVKLVDALRERGWSDDDVRGFTHLNWLRYWRNVANGKRRRTNVAAPE